ncbi:MAG: sigma-70 family RNA polymerase sigma factor [Nannocystaceae bacterium]
MPAVLFVPATSATLVSLAPVADPLKTALERARAGDARAFAALYRSCVGRIYALCLRLSQDRARAETLTQDVFVRAWQKLDSYRGDAVFSTWLHRLAINVVLQDKRSENRRRARERADADAAPSHISPHGKTDASLDLERALSVLPERCLHVFVLSQIEGMRHDEIAEALNIAVGTSKAQLHRARALLKEALR